MHMWICQCNRLTLSICVVAGVQGRGFPGPAAVGLQGACSELFKVMLVFLIIN